MFGHPQKVILMEVGKLELRETVRGINIVYLWGSLAVGAFKVSVFGV